MAATVASGDPLLHRLEALLFSSGRKMAVDELCRLCRERPEAVVAMLSRLREKYDAADSALFVLEEKDGWKLAVREVYLPLVRKIVAETELSKTVMETLSVVAWRAPVLQSDVIRIRTNKAYDHLRELEDAGFISRAKHGRTHLIKLTERFYQYFDLSRDELKKHFAGVKEAGTAMEKLDLQQKDRKLDDYGNGGAAEGSPAPSVKREHSGSGEERP